MVSVYHLKLIYFSYGTDYTHNLFFGHTPVTFIKLLIILTWSVYGYVLVPREQNSAQLDSAIRSH